MRTLISFGFFFLLPFFAKAQEFTLVQINAKWNIKNNIELNIDKEEIMKYLNLDYYVYNQIINSPNLWKWQQGKIF